MKNLARAVVDRLASRMAVPIAKRAADDLSHRLITSNPSAGLGMLMLNAALSAVPSGVSPYKLFAGIDDDTWFWIHTEGYRKNAALREILPGLPDADYQRQSVGAAGDEGLQQGLGISRVFKQIYEAHAGNFSACRAVLDFGCGWGRVLRFYLKDIEPARLWGIDVYDKAVEFCQQSNRWCNFARNDAFPPTTFPDGMFDLVFAYSVFSHLSEETHLKWVEEFHRILAPGGILIVTTWSRDLIQRCQDLRTARDLPPWQTHLPGLFPDTRAALAAYDAGQFCFDTSSAMYGKSSAWIGEAVIPKGYVTTRWSEHFESLDFVVDDPICRQNIIVVKNK